MVAVSALGAGCFGDFKPEALSYKCAESSDCSEGWHCDKTVASPVCKLGPAPNPTPEDVADDTVTPDVPIDTPMMDIAPDVIEDVPDIPPPDTADVSDPPDVPDTAAPACDPDDKWPLTLTTPQRLVQGVGMVAHDTGWVVVGRSRTADNQIQEGLGMGINANGEAVWTKYYGKYTKILTAAEQTEAGYVLVGGGGVVIGVQSNGIYNWDGQTGAYNTGIVQGPETWLLVSGRTTIDGLGRALVQQVTGDGVDGWVATAGMQGHTQANGIALAQGGDTIVVGEAQLVLDGLRRVWAARIDVLGGLVWQKHFFDVDGFAAGVATTEAGVTVVVGSRGLTKSGFALGLTSDGVALWERPLGGGGTDHARGVVAAGEGVTVFGDSESLVGGERIGVLFGLTADGEVSWQSGPPVVAQQASLSLLGGAVDPDGGIIVTGESVVDDVTSMHVVAVGPKGDGSCLPGPDGATCSDGGSCTAAACDLKACVGGQCVTAAGECGPKCGDGVLNAGEQCDDGNTTNDDGCWDDCFLEGGLTGMLYVPGGAYWMGCDDCEALEGPAHQVVVTPFFMSAHEITVELYEGCVDDLGCTEPVLTYSDTSKTLNWGAPDRQNHPINGVTWAQAADYCAKLGPTVRLPTEAEWELAARGPCTGTAEDCAAAKAPWPWGPTEATCEWAVMNDGVSNCGAAGTLPVGSKPAGESWAGVQDLAGNVAEWVADPLVADYYANSPKNDPQGADFGFARQTRGGSYNDDAPGVRATRRVAQVFAPATATATVGFRCVMPTKPACDDANPCTLNEVGLGSCSYPPDPANPWCSDGNGCTGPDLCQNGTCKPGLEAVECDDGVDCTVDACNPESGCKSEPINTLCNDSKECTVDVCHTTEGCSSMPKGGACNDGDPCTQADICTGEICGGTPIDCQKDAAPCELGACNAGNCVYTPLAPYEPCDDGDPCTGGELCVANACGQGVALCDQAPVATLTSSVTSAPSVNVLPWGGVLQQWGTTVGDAFWRLTNAVGDTENGVVVNASVALSCPMCFQAAAVLEAPDGFMRTQYEGTMNGDGPMNVERWTSAGQSDGGGKLFDLTVTASEGTILITPRRARMVAFAGGSVGAIFSYGASGEYEGAPVADAVHYVRVLADLSKSALSELVKPGEAATARFDVVPVVAEDGFVLAWVTEDGKKIELETYSKSGKQTGVNGTITPSIGGAVHDVRIGAGPAGPVVAWTQDMGSTGLDVRVVRLNWGLVEVAAQKHVVNIAGEQRVGGVAVLTGGKIVIAYDGIGIDDSEYGVGARILNPSTGAFSAPIIVNTLVGGAQDSPSVAALDDGGWIVAFRDAKSIYERRFDADGDPVPQPGEVVINDQQAGAQTGPAGALVSDADGEPKVWVAWEGPAIGGGALDIHGRWTTADGYPTTPQVQVNLTATGEQSEVQVAGGGDRVVTVWTDYADADLDQSGIFALVTDGAGKALGGQVQVNQLGLGPQRYPSVAMHSDGGFAVAYVNEKSSQLVELYVRFFPAVGDPSADHLVSAPGAEAGQIGATELVINSAGDVIALWPWRATDNGNDDNILLRRVTSAGPQGVEKEVNTTLDGLQTIPAAAFSADDKTLAVCFADDPPDAESDVRCRMLDAGSFAGTADFLVHPPSSANQNRPDVAALGDGFMVVWDSPGIDGSERAVQYRPFTTSGIATAQAATANRTTLGDQWDPFALAAPNNTVVVGWQSDNVDSDGAGIVLRVLSGN